MSKFKTKRSVLFIKSTSLIFILFFTIFSRAQNSGDLTDYTGICIGSTQTYSAGFNAGNAMDLVPGNNYGCLNSTPNSKWFYFKVDKSGVLKIKQRNSNNLDVDGAVWGPFTSLEDVVSKSGSFPAPVACDFSSGPNFDFEIPNTEIGQFYVLLVTNYSNNATEITLEDNGSVAQTDCTPDIQVRKSVNITEVKEGDEVTWTIDAVNMGALLGTGVSIKDVLPAGVTYVSHTVNMGTYDHNTGIWEIGDMTPIVTKPTLKIITKVNQGTGNTTITNSISEVNLNETESGEASDVLSASIHVISKEEAEKDTDGDGIPDVDDLDDDNDGILDIVEKNCSTTTVPGAKLSLVSLSGLSNLVTNDFYEGIDTSLELVLDIRKIAPKGTVINLRFNKNKKYAARPIISSSKDNVTYITDTKIDYSSTDTDSWYSVQYVLREPARYIRIRKSGLGKLSISKTHRFEEFVLVESCSDVDTDGDGVPDYLDLDSDNDGINDVDESNTLAVDANGDGMVDGPYGQNGLANAVESDDTNKATVDAPIDTDGDGIPDYRDIDSDNDGTPDSIDSTPYGDGSTPPQSQDPSADANGDGVVDNTTDNDGDGIADVVDGNPNIFGDKPNICEIAPNTGTTTKNTQVGISTLKRENNEWLSHDNKLGAYLVLESTTKGFVIPRFEKTADITNNIGTDTSAGIEEGMIVWDKEANCLKMFFDKNNDGTMTWNCISSNSCTNLIP